MRKKRKSYGKKKRITNDQRRTLVIYGMRPKEALEIRTTESGAYRLIKNFKDRTLRKLLMLSAKKKEYFSENGRCIYEGSGDDFPTLGQIRLLKCYGFSREDATLLTRYQVVEAIDLLKRRARAYGYAKAKKESSTDSLHI